MNTTKILGAIVLVGLFGISSTFASDTYSTKEVFLKAEGKTCKMATDGCNSFFVKDGKIGGGTLMYCEDIYGKNGQEKWSCEDKKTSIKNSYIVVLKKGTDKNSVINAVKKLANVEYGKIIFNTGDLVMFTIETTDKTAITKIEKITGVDYVEQNQEVSVAGKTKTYPTKEAFIQAEGKTCETATDGVNTFFGKDFMASTMIGYPENFVEKWSCVAQKESNLSENDENLLKHLQKTLNKNLKTKIDTILAKYEKKLKKLKNPQETNNKVIEKVETKISDFLMKYPQDVALPTKAATLYNALEYLKLSLMNIDFDEKNTAENQISHTKTLEVIGVFGEMDGDSIELIGFDDNGEYDFAQKYSTIFSIPNLGDNYISVKQGDRLTITGEFSNNRIFSITKLTAIKNPKKEECEAQKNKKWKPQGKAQIPTCLTSYSDGGKTCTSSSQCEGNCIKTHPEKPAMCEENSSKFGCKTTIENFNAGEGILCMD